MRNHWENFKDRIEANRRALLPVSLLVAGVAGTVLLLRSSPNLFPAQLLENTRWLGKSLENLPGPGSVRQNRLKERQQPRLGEKFTGSDFDAALQLSQSVLATARNFYVDAARVSERQLAEVLLKVLKKSSPSLESSISQSGMFSMNIEAGEAKYPLTVAGLSDAVAAAAVATAGGGVKVLDRVREILHEMVSELDPHSSVMSPSAYNELRQGTEGSFGGLGVLVTIKDRVLTVIKPLPNSPAIRAGILPGDRIVRINGQATFGMALEDLMDFMRGNPGTQVQMRILRRGRQAPLDILLNREVIQVDSVTATPLPDSKLRVLQVAVETFSAKTSREILSAIKEFKRRTGGLDGLVLDLRSNPGGLLDQAVQVADLFLEDGVIVSTRGRRQEVELAGKGYDETDFPMVVLVDEESASASEIVAGALQDHGRAVVVGQPTFGKGSVQTVFELPFEVALKLTIARYYTPADRSIQNVGIVPDVWLQPVVEGEQNLNLLGASRYRNESFLLHNLDANSDARNHVADLDQRMSGSCCGKSYFMNWKAQGTEVDEDMAVARTIIEAYPRDGMASAPLNSSGSVRTRTTMNLEPVGAHLKKTISDVSSWLRDRFAVYWDDPNDKGQLVEVATNPNALAFQAEVLASANPGPGDDIRVVWTVANKGKQPVRRISVFLRTTGVSGETQESLVGTLEAGQSRSGSFSAKPPFFPADGVWEVDSGIAVDGWPVALHSRKIEVKIPGRDRPVLSVSSSIVEEKGGVSNGVLDPGEQAKLHVVINNTGTVDVSDLSVTLTNLSGERISLSDSEPGKLSIKGGSVGFVDVPLVFHGGVSADELDVGISLESRALDGPLVQNVTLPVSTIAGRIGSLGGKSAE